MKKSTLMHDGGAAAAAPRAPQLAVLIDAENAHANIARKLFEEIAKIGEASVRRIYGDFLRSELRAWTRVLAEHAIKAEQNFAYTAGKNGADIALVIDAMDLLHTGRFDGFCLVSSDSDFTGLATRIREQGADVYGFGEKKTPESFRQACRQFIFTEGLVTEEPAPAEPARRGSPKRVVKQPAGAAAPLIGEAIAKLDDGKNEGWVSLGGLTNKLPVDFKPQTYGCKKLSTLVEKAGGFEMRKAYGNAQVRVKAAE